MVNLYNSRHKSEDFCMIGLIRKCLIYYILSSWGAAVGVIFNFFGFKPFLNGR